MPTKRKPRSRTWHQARITPEALTLFLKLEDLSQDTEAFKDGSHALARMLGCVPEWWTCNHVNDRSRKPCHPPRCQAHTDWHKVRAVRAALLAALGPTPGAGRVRPASHPK